MNGRPRTPMGLCLIVLAALPSRSMADQPRADRVFVGYLYGPVRDLDYRLYTHLCHAFLVADEQGRVRTSRSVPSRELTSQAHQAGVKVLLSLGGWGWDRQFAAIVASPEAETRYLQSLRKIVDDYDYDGIDLDWEYPDTEAEVIGFERLTRRIRKDLDEIGRKKGRAMTLTMAAAADPGTLRWLDRDFLVETMDWINVMTYDMAGDWTDYAGHHSPLFASTKVAQGRAPSVAATMKYLLEERRVPADRLAVGIPLYGRGFAASEPYGSKQGAPPARVSENDYRNLHRLQHQDGWTRTWDDETKTPWLLAPDRKAVIGYDDPESVALKTQWAMKQGFRGIFFWQIHADRMPDGSRPLQESARREWDKAQRP